MRKKGEGHGESWRKRGNKKIGEALHRHKTPSQTFLVHIIQFFFSSGLSFHAKSAKKFTFLTFSLSC